MLAVCFYFTLLSNMLVLRALCVFVWTPALQITFITVWKLSNKTEKWGCRRSLKWTLTPRPRGPHTENWKATRASSHILGRRSVYTSLIKGRGDWRCQTFSISRGPHTHWGARNVWFSYQGWWFSILETDADRSDLGKSLLVRSHRLKSWRLLVLDVIYFSSEQNMPVQSGWTGEAGRWRTYIHTLRQSRPSP